jgi:hypothetical protein
MARTAFRTRKERVHLMQPLAHQNRLLCVVVLAGLIASGLPAYAQNAPVEDVDGAARAFEEGQRAQLHRDYARAAELFELADRSAPNAAALRSAIRNFEASGNPAHAATLAARAIERYPNDAETRKLAERVVAHLGPTLGELVVRCSLACALVLDGGATSDAPLTAHRIYVTPGDHAVIARFNDGRSASRPVTAAAGATSELAVDPPPAPPVVATTPSPTAEAPASAVVTSAAPALVAPAPERPDRRLSPAVAIVGMALTAGLAGALVWSGLDTLSARDKYTANPTKAGYDDGLSRQYRTDGLIAGTAALGVATIAIAIFATRWHRRPPGERRVSFRPFGAGGATVGLAVFQ